MPFISVKKIITAGSQRSPELPRLDASRLIWVFCWHFTPCFACHRQTQSNLIDANKVLQTRYWPWCSIFSLPIFRVCSSRLPEKSELL